MARPELLLPAGDIEKMKFALAWGADAVYLGIPKYSLRARENGFLRKEIAEAVHYVQERGKKVYLTANVIPHNHKVEPFVEYVAELLGLCSPDAWIMSDPGIIMYMRERFPDETIHLSVQSNTVNFASARFWQSVGVKRIILSRELSLKEIARIKEACPQLELEAFVHGAICIAYSGRCLISNYMSRRDPNQGVCSHSCRWKYKMYEKRVDADADNPEEGQEEGRATSSQAGQAYQRLHGDFYVEEMERPGQFMQIDEDENGTYLMNAKDLCTMEHLDEMRSVGVESFKVEGRSKSVYYVAVVARAYRRAIDDMMAGRPLNPDNLKEVYSTSNRGFVAGFLKGAPGSEAQNYETTRSDCISHRFAAELRGYDPFTGLADIDVRNPIRMGTHLELIEPERTLPFVVEQLVGRDGEPAEIVHGGIDGCKIRLPEAPHAFALLREVL